MPSSPADTNADTGASTGPGKTTPAANTPENERAFPLIAAVLASDLDAIEKAPTLVLPPDLAARFGSLLNLAVSSAPLPVVAAILARCEPSSQDIINAVALPSGETPLHVAARLGRGDVVRLLLKQESISTVVRDASGRSPADAAKASDIAQAIAERNSSFAAAATYKMLELSAAPNAAAALAAFFADPRVAALADINHVDPASGSTVLHNAARAGDAVLVCWALEERHADPFLRDARGKYFYELTRDEHIKTLFKNASQATHTLVTSGPNQMPHLEGMLYKWTNYATGYKSRWFVLENGELSYYRAREDVPSSCRATINLKVATLWEDRSDKHRFDVLKKNSFRFHLRAPHVHEARRWIQAIALSKKMHDEIKFGTGAASFHSAGCSISTAQLTSATSSPSLGATCTVNSSGQSESAANILDLPPHFLRADSSPELIDDRGDSFLLSPPGLGAAGKTHYPDGSEPSEPNSAIADTCPSISQNTFRIQLEFLLVLVEKRCNDCQCSGTRQPDSLIAAVARTISAFDEFVRLDIERNQQLKSAYSSMCHRVTTLEEALAKLAIDYGDIEAEARKLDMRVQSTNAKKDVVNSAKNSIPEENTSCSLVPGGSLLSDTHSVDKNDKDSNDDDDEEFYDVEEKDQSIISRSLEGYESETYSFSRNLRSSLPVDHALIRNETSLWSVLKNAIGKDLTRITLPVFFNEPISMLQRLCEDIEYVQLLDMAWRRDASDERLLYVAAFAVSSYSSTVDRTGKPFNPLLGETFEYVRKDRGLRYISEQVSHHPPITACHCESDHYEFYGEVNVRNKFWGKSLEILPQGTVHVIIKRGHVGEPDEHYSWKKVTTSVKNIIVGTLWIDHYGEMEVKNHKTGERVVFKFKPTGWCNRDRCVIEGRLFSPENKETWEITGKWDDRIVCKALDESQRHRLLALAQHTISTAAAEGALNQSAKAQNSSSLALAIGLGQSESSSAAPPASVATLWKRGHVELTKSNFNLTPFALTLNQMPPGLPKYLCPTDCRLRPDQRSMEEGQYDVAAGEKHQLEEKQRHARKASEAGGGNTGLAARWFARAMDTDTNEAFWKFTGEYWKARETHAWSQVPAIFLEKP